MSAPFRRGRFAKLPERPPIPHPWFDLPSRTVAVDSAALGPVDVHVVEAGEGPPLLLVHGLMTTGYSWRYVMEPLARHFKVFAPDLPGAGRSSKPLAPSYGVHNLGTGLLEIQQALGITGCAVIGNSLGGTICAAAMAQAPAAMSRLLILHAPGFPEPRLHLLHAALSIPGSTALLGWMVRRDPLRWAHRNVHYWDEDLKSLEEAREYGLPLAAPGGCEAFAKFLRETLDPRGFRRLQRELAALREHPPVRLLYARRDPMVPPRLGPRWKASLPAAELLWIEEASHFAHVDAPDAFLAAALPFVRGG